VPIARISLPRQLTSSAVPVRIQVHSYSDFGDGAAKAPSELRCRLRGIQYRLDHNSDAMRFRTTWRLEKHHGR